MDNIKTLPVVVGMARIREYGSNGEYFNIECAKSVRATISTSETVKINCGRGESATFEKPSSTLTLKVIKTKNPTLLGKLLGLTVTNTTNGTTTITDESNIFDADGKIELNYRSNDGLGITALVVKKTDGTSLVKDTDYTVQIVDNRTIITIKGTNISAGDTVLISGTVNQNAAKEIIIERVQRIKKKFEVELFGENQDSTTPKKMTTIRSVPVELNSDYLLEMFDVFNDGEPQGAELNFILSDNGKTTIRDENI